MDDALRRERLLGRASFGPRPGDREGLLEAGAEAWLEAQLAASPALDAGLAPRLSAFPALVFREAQFLGDAAEERMSRSGPEDRKGALLKAHALALGVARQLAGARIVRAVHGERGLHEVMVDFWSNHFSVDARKSIVGGLLPHYQREVLDRHALGRFEDLLLAVARSPAMLVYLDNWSSSASPPRRVRRGGGRARGINENYARELLELHTLGIDGGYDQADVVATARALTGWSLESRNRPVFRFHAALHDGGSKTVLSGPVTGEGEAEGEGLLRRLARHPATARHVSRKLAVRFVSDAPPDDLVQRVARTFLEREGDIPSVLRTLLLSPELADPAHRKLKTPLRLYASALRESGGSSTGSPETLLTLARLGELPFFARTPAGHPEASPRWIDPGAVLERMRLGFSLAGDDTALGLRFAAPEFQWS